MPNQPTFHSDPEILGGVPVFFGTRVPVQALYDYLEGGDSLDEFLEDFPSVSREQAMAALEARPRHHVWSPRLAQPEKASDFVKDVIGGARGTSENPPR